MSKDSEAVVALSGGMDSATVLGWLIAEGFAVTAVGFIYGSKHNPYEQACARTLAEHYKVDFRTFNLTSIMGGFNSNLLKSGGDIPEGHYEDESMSLTVVPGRNMIFATILAGLADSIGAQLVALGIHQGDHAIYPDCRTEFFKAMDSAIYLGTGAKVQLTAPFLETDKKGILTWGLKHDVPYHLTRTCYKDQVLPCGVCGSCQERLEAFEKIGEKDPIEYE